jgi:hypothetical protein
VLQVRCVAQLLRSKTTMNKERRKAIADLISALQAIDLSQIRDQVESIRDEEQEYFDAMPENFQSGDKGQAAETAISALDDAISALEYIDLSEIVSHLETAAA